MYAQKWRFCRLLLQNLEKKWRDPSPRYVVLEMDTTWLTSEIFCDRKCKKHTPQKLSCLLRCLSLKVWAEWSKYASISIIVITKNHEITIPHISTTLSLAIAPGKSLFYHPLEQLTSRVRKPKNYAT